MPDDAAAFPTSAEAQTIDGDREAKAPARPGRMRAVLLIGGAILAVAAGVGLFNWWTVGRFMQSTNDAYLRADQVVVAPKVQGYVTQVLVSDNQQVAAGQPLVRIDPRSYQAGAEQAQAAIDEREADVAAARAQLVQQQSVIDQARAQLASARSGAAFAAGEVERYRPLAASGADTPEKLQQLINSRDQAQQSANANGASLAAAQHQVETLKAQIGQAGAQLEAARANARQVGLNLQDTLLTSAIPGRVGDKTVQLGQYVTAGARLMTIVPTGSIYLVANFKETQLARMRPGQPVTIHVDALGGKALKGVVDSFAPGTGAQFALLPPENATGNFTKIVQRVPVRIRVEVPPEARAVLAPGLSATAKVDTRSPL